MYLSLCPVCAKSVPKQASASEYEALLAKYLSCSDRIASEREQRRVEFYKKRLEHFRKKGAEISRTEDTVLEKLRAEKRLRQGKKLDFEGDMLETTVLIPTSDVSARIFGALLRENAVDTFGLVSALHSDSAILSKGWVTLVRKIAAESDPGLPTWRWAALTLYKAGVSKGVYRPALERMAIENGDTTALDALFFRSDKETGKRLKVQTSENIFLMKKLVNVKSRPEVRVACANYAAEVGDRNLAEAVCIELVSTRYKGQDNTNALPPDEDYTLARAKTAAIGLMFYGIRNERAFKLIYDLSRLPQTEMDNEKKMPPGWVRSDFCVLVDMDVKQAQSLIGMVREK